MHPTTFDVLFCRLLRWKRDKALSFVPPDGRFTLMEYRYLPPTSKSLSAPSARVPVPFTLKPAVTIEEDGGMADHKLQIYCDDKFNFRVFQYQFDIKVVDAGFR